MTSDQLIDQLSRYVNLNALEAEALLQRMQKLNVAKKEVLIEAGQFVDTFYWVQSGCLMAFHRDAEGQEHALQFAITKWWTTDLAGFAHEKPAEHTLVALDDSEVFAIKRSDFDTLLTIHPVFERYFRKIFQNALIAHQQRILNNIALNAEDRYEQFLAAYGAVEQWAAQKHIASYLGITPEFLSKLRRRRAGG